MDRRTSAAQRAAMEDSVSLEGIAEVSITLAGFATLQMGLRSGPLHRWHPRARFSFWTTLTWSVGALVFSYAPTLLAPLGVATWTLPCLLLATFLASAASWALRHHVRLSRAGAPSQAPLNLALSLALSYLGALAALVGALGLVSATGESWYRLAVILCLFAALPPFLASFRIREEPPAGF